MKKPLLILPCSADKKEGSWPAHELYQGKGYLSVLKKYWKGTDDRFNVAFLSAKCGLVMSDEVIESYELKMTPDIAAEMKTTDHVKGQALRLISKANPGFICACLPELYMSVLDSWIDCEDTIVMRPLKGSGIGEQRGFLKRFLESIGSAPGPELYVFHFPSQREHIMAKVVVAPGDIITPWIDGNPAGDNARYHTPVCINNIERDKFGRVSRIVDANGNKWQPQQVTMGLSVEEKTVAIEHCDGISTKKGLLMLSDIQRHIEKTVCKSLLQAA